MNRDTIEVVPHDDADAKIVRLKEEHQALERRLDELDKLVYLTPDEQLERKRIQKKKLHKKDMIRALKRHSSN